MPGISSPSEKSTVFGHRFGSPGFTVTAFVHIKSKESRSTWLPAYGCNFPKKTREEFGSWIFSRVWQSKNWENFSSYLCIFCYGGSYSHLVRPRLGLMKHRDLSPSFPTALASQSMNSESCRVNSTLPLPLVASASAVGRVHKRTNQQEWIEKTMLCWAWCPEGEGRHHVLCKWHRHTIVILSL